MAIIYNDILDNTLKDKHIVDDITWTRATSAYLMERIPFISRTTIIKALDRLVEKNYLIVGYPYSESGKHGNEGKWFALGHSFLWGPK